MVKQTHGPKQDVNLTKSRGTRTINALGGKNEGGKDGGVNEQGYPRTNVRKNGRVVFRACEERKGEAGGAMVAGGPLGASHEGVGVLL